MNILKTGRLPPLLLAVTLPLAGTGAFAAGSHGGGHGHGKKVEGHAEMEKKGHDHGHGQASIDYSSVEEHEFGKASDPEHASTTVTINMNDTMRFDPDVVRVKPGETVRFVVRNNGKLNHEMVLGTADSLGQHAKLMQKFPGMEHDEPYMTHVDSGKEQVMGWQFTRGGEFSYGCLVPGHFEAGMKGRVIVE